MLGTSIENASEMCDFKMEDVVLSLHIGVSYLAMLSAVLVCAAGTEPVLSQPGKPV